MIYQVDMDSDARVLMSHLAPLLKRKVKETVRSLFAAHDADIHDHINKLQDKDYAGEEETWPAMEHHVYVIADTLAAAVVKQFPKRFM